MDELLLTEPLVLSIGWALMHFLWQGTLIAVSVALALRGLTGFSPAARHTVACAGLAMMLIAPVGTFVSLWNGASTAKLAMPASTARPVVAFDGPATVTAEATGGTTSPLPTDLERFLSIAVAMWVAGVVLFSMRLAAACYGIGRLKRATQEVDEELRARVAALSRRLGLTRSTRVLVSTVAQVPAVVGCLRPVLLLPASAITGLPVAHLDAVIAHELAHLRRRDHLVNAMQAVVETLLFYHPVVWWCSRQIRIEREHCCDDIVVEACADRLVYATALARLEDMRRAEPALALSAGGGRLLDRIHRLLAPASPVERRSPTWVVVAGLATALAVVVSVPASSDSARLSSPPVSAEQAPAAAPRAPRAPAPQVAAPPAPAPQPAPAVPAAPAPRPTPAPPAAPQAPPVPDIGWSDVERQFQEALETIARSGDPDLANTRREIEIALEALARETGGMAVYPESPQPPEPPASPGEPSAIPAAPAAPLPPAPPVQDGAAPIEQARANLQRAELQLMRVRSELARQQEQLRLHEQLVERQRMNLQQFEEQMARARADLRSEHEKAVAAMQRALEEAKGKQQALRANDAAEMRKLREQLEAMREQLKAMGRQF